MPARYSRCLIRRLSRFRKRAQASRLTRMASCCAICPAKSAPAFLWMDFWLDMMALKGHRANAARRVILEKREIPANQVSLALRDLPASKGYKASVDPLANKGQKVLKAKTENEDLPESAAHRAKEALLANVAPSESKGRQASEARTVRKDRLVSAVRVAYRGRKVCRAYLVRKVNLAKQGLVDYLAETA